MKRLMGMASLAGTLLVAGALTAGPAWASQGDPQRAGDLPVMTVTPDNGGDNGWGNCGWNSSRGNPHTGTNGQGGGNGGMVDQCRPDNPGNGHDGDTCSDSGTMETMVTSAVVAGSDTVVEPTSVVVVGGC